MKLVFTAQYKCSYMFMSTGSKVRRDFIQRILKDGLSGRI